MCVEKLGPVVVVHRVDIDCAEGETDVNDDKDEEEDHHINDHVGHGDDDGSGLPPHQASLEKKNVQT